jgi:hypothetical protein
MQNCWWAPWLSVRVFSHFHTISGRSRDSVTCHRHRITFTDQLRWFPLISDDFRWFLPSGDISHSLLTPIWHHAALQKFYGSVKQLPRTLECRYIKIVRLHQHTTSAWHWHSNLEIAHNHVTGVMGLIWICWMLELVWASGAWFWVVKFSCHHPFHFKFSYNIYTPLYIPEKQVELADRGPLLHTAKTSPLLLLRTAKGYAFAQVLFLPILLCKANNQNLSQSLSSHCTHHRCAYQKNLVNVVGQMHIWSWLLIWLKFGVKISDLPLLIPGFFSQAPLDTCKVAHYFKYIWCTDFFPCWNIP